MSILFVRCKKGPMCLYRFTDHCSESPGPVHGFGRDEEGIFIYHMFVGSKEKLIVCGFIYTNTDMYLRPK